jgi:hypothetical protein
MTLLDRFVPELDVDLAPPDIDIDGTEPCLLYCIGSALVFLLVLSLIICGKLT